MACFKTLNLNLAASAGDMPLDSATYVPGVDKILGMMGPYCVKCNAATGVREAIARVASPIMGPCFITYHAATGLAYASCWFAPDWVDETANDASDQSDIFPINPTTMAVGPALGLITNIPLLGGGTKLGLNGPWEIISQGSYLYGLWRNQAGGGYPFRIDPSNTADNASTSSDDWNNWNQNCFDVDATPVVYWAIPDQELQKAPGDFTGYPLPPWDSISLVPVSLNHTPVAVAWDGTVLWAVCGNNILYAGNFAFPPGTTFLLDNGAVITGAISGIRPFRIRRNPYTGLLYIPCQNKDCVIVFNTGTGTGVLKSGFDGPVDAVFTPTRSFAVQSGPTGLKEIT